MLIIFKVTVASAGTSGPLLGDGVKTTVTPILPSTLTEDRDSMGARLSVYNRAAASGRARYTVARVQIIGLRANTNLAFWGGAGSVAANMVELANAQGYPLGFGDRNDTDLGDLDADVTTSGEGFLVVAEVR
jgi:hypothetical protein